jgi:Putative peptidoglycan binding domain
MNIRKLRQDEIQEARKVFHNSINYEEVYISPYTDDSVAFRGGAMTWVYQDKTSNRWFYVIWWSPRVYTEGAIAEQENRTLIHELTHVWQGQHGSYPTKYWYGAAKSQGFEGLKDIVEKKGFTSWNEHRGRAYAYGMNNIGVNNWNDFNYEQQGSIVEHWYTSGTWTNHFGDPMYGGEMSTLDPRYPFVTINIRAGSIDAKFIPIKPLGRGADGIIMEIENKLVELGYLSSRYADGYKENNMINSVREFQRNNGLKVDGDLGGSNSNTRKKLSLPTSQLIPAGVSGGVGRARI